MIYKELRCTYVRKRKLIIFNFKKDCVQLAIKGIVGIAYWKNEFPHEKFIAVYSVGKSLHLRVWRFIIAVHCPKGRNCRT